MLEFRSVLEGPESLTWHSSSYNPMKLLGVGANRAILWKLAENRAIIRMWLAGAPCPTLPGLPRATKARKSLKALWNFGLAKPLPRMVATNSKGLKSLRFQEVGRGNRATEKALITAGYRNLQSRFDSDCRNHWKTKSFSLIFTGVRKPRYFMEL